MQRKLWKLNVRKHDSHDDKASYQSPRTWIKVPTSPNRYQLETGVCPGSTVDIIAIMTNDEMCQLHVFHCVSRFFDLALGRQQCIR